MKTIDWIILALTISSIILFGIYKNRKDENIDSYLLGNKSLPWYHVGLSVMATQASAITFLSAPGLGYLEGTKFVQFYFGLPLAMIVLCITFIPIYHKLRVFTAYEFLETRFDARVRVFTAILFLVSRALATGISIYAPSIILSTIFNCDLMYTNLIMGGLVLIYTVIGGSKAISYTHLQQMFFILFALSYAAYLIIDLLPTNLKMNEIVSIAGYAGKMKTIDWNFNPSERYNIWSGIIGGFFLQLSYFGTDQSQVGRYLTGNSIKQSRMGLLMNGLLKIPMQFGILMIGVLVYVFYLFNSTPLFFNKVETNRLLNSSYKNEYLSLEKQNFQLNNKKRFVVENFALQKESTAHLKIELKNIELNQKNLKAEISKLIVKNKNHGDDNDVNYIFLRFILDYLPHGFIGLLIAVIFSASMGSVASAYHSLAATSLIDVVSKTRFKAKNEDAELKYSKYFTIFWGIFCILVAMFAQKLGNSMLELVNILGSWFYGVILGIFLAAFYFKKIKARAIFYGAVLAQIGVILVWYQNWVSFLWLNPLGVFLVLGFSSLFQINTNEFSKKNIDC